MTKVITDKHPFMQKVNKLYEFMDKEKISIEYGGTGGLVFTDTENNKTYRLKDMDTSEYLAYFPTGFEFKLTFEE